MIVSVFQTNISDSDLVHLAPVLDSWRRIINWNIDLEDEDNILRVESEVAIHTDITTILNIYNLTCTELE